MEPWCEGTEVQISRGETANIFGSSWTHHHLHSWKYFCGEWVTASSPRLLPTWSSLREDHPDLISTECQGLKQSGTKHHWLCSLQCWLAPLHTDRDEAQHTYSPDTRTKNGAKSKIHISELTSQRPQEARLLLSKVCYGMRKHFRAVRLPLPSWVLPKATGSRLRGGPKLPCGTASGTAQCSQASSSSSPVQHECYLPWEGAWARGTPSLTSLPTPATGSTRPLQTRREHNKNCLGNIGHWSFILHELASYS